MSRGLRPVLAGQPRRRAASTWPGRRKADGLFASGLEIGQPVGLACRPIQEMPAFARRVLSSDAFQGIPKLGVPAGLFVDREIAFQHAALGAKDLDARFDPGPPGFHEFFGLSLIHI